MMIFFLDLITIVSIGLLIGTELAVSAFVNPVLRMLDDRAQADAIRLFARRLGFAMPFWYSGSLLLLVIEMVKRFHQPEEWLLGAATGIWIAVIVLTLLFLVPINNRMMRMNPGEFRNGAAQREHQRWDLLHRFRVAALTVAMILLLAGIYR
jgi:uncharacterized membrane protein